jgi:dye decolorizing peroxidase
VTATSRRQVLTGAAAGITGIAAGLGLAATTGWTDPDAPRTPRNSPPSDPVQGSDTVPFHGAHQAGIATEAPAHAAFLGLTLKPAVVRDDVRRLLRLVTDDAARLTQGRPALGDTEPQLATVPARLTVTVGFGPGLFERIGRPDARPASVADLPAFAGDKLQARWTGGDLVLQVCTDDPVTLAHTLRMLTKDVRRFATVRWLQRGFRSARGSTPTGTTMRNLMGQVDGSVNPVPGTAEFAATVWSRGPGWFAGGTVLVLRRIRMELETWDAFDTAGKEFVVGRRLAGGAPLTGTVEHDVPDLDAVDAHGFPVIDDTAHVRLAHAGAPSELMFRRGYNYDEGPTADGTADAGLLFAAYQADADTAFVPVQRRLAGHDALNRWITHIGSAVFAVPPGVAEGDYLGRSLVDG